jgi:prepilin-type N-terminal cleavage/methylation domain
MNTSVRARHAERGFSFVELLVTIIIAGIAFAALVPVFVAASQKGRGDSARNVSLNLAQDRIEKIRELDYDVITVSNLQSKLGTSAVMPSGGGSKTYTVDYSVTFVGGTNDGQDVVSSGDGSEKYKLVGVDVFWTGNPRPVKHAVLKTIVYKQYTGSYLDSLTTPTEPLGNLSRQFITSYTIVLTAKVNAADIANTKSVVFRVYGVDGSQLKRLVRYATDTTGVTTTGEFTQTYTILGTNGLIATEGSRDGTYTFKAVAVNKNGYEGNTQAITLPVENGIPPVPNGIPPVPSGLAAAATNKTVDLTWNKSSAGDVTSYLVYSRKSTESYGDPQTVTVALGQVPSFTATGLTNGTTYYFKVAAVDSLVKTSAACPEISAKPVTPADTWPPGDVTVTISYTDPLKLTAPPPLTLRLVWTGVTDPGSGSSSTGVVKYLIYRRTSSGTFAATPTFTILAQDTAYWNSASNQYTFNDSSGLAPVVTYYYQVKALDGAGNLSLLPAAGDNSGSKVTQNYDYCSVTVKNNSTSKGAILRVVNPDGSAIGIWPTVVTNPAGSVTVLRNESQVWKLPVGFAFKAGWQLSGSSETFKPIPASGVISSTTSFTVSFP